MEIKSLANVDFDLIYKAFNLAFADYEVKQDKKQLLKMLRRRGFDPDLSFAAFDNNQIIAFTLNGIGSYNGIQTAYDTGTGTLKDYRGKGLASEVFKYSIPYLKKKGIEQYLLEVLQHNTKAVSVYKNLGFKVTREFNYFVQKKEDIGIIKEKGDQVFKEKRDPGYLIRQIDIERVESAFDYWDFCPSWQNGFESIKRASGDFIVLGAFYGSTLAGYCVFEPESGDLTQIAVDPEHRREGIASRLLNEAVKTNRSDVIKIINTDISCDSMNGFVESKGIQLKGKQFEMVKKL
ncbi:MAG: GNAT family N-acetyltransferase [Bacteroidales bacterium]|nr:GNAT family N-acetyltransferase [Bacteroidales bacterium]MDD2424393.1 GNAT family N-acetyltransferase [Bacteroidales bacterium]MDD3988975.1 GNAT family N-acetyltransferase [Bacteroidales bacterium]MDD4639631.1 GNAT family N-acetyltransferase [Bacteroidales bacterium]